MEEKIYLHGIYAASDIYDSKTTLKIFKHILKDNALLSARLQNRTDFSILFNGLDYISLCDYEKRLYNLNNMKNAYESYIRYSLSLVFPKNKLDVVVPQIIDIKYADGYYQKMKELGLSTDIRYSDMPDEVQVKDKISLDLMSGITLPVSKMRNCFLNEDKTVSMVLKEIDKIKELLYKYNHLVPLYDIDTLEKLDESTTKKLVRHYYKNRG